MFNFPIDVTEFEDNTAAPKMPSLKERQDKQTAALNEKLDELRRLSNVIQALENVIMQCDNQAAFEGIQQVAEDQIGDLQKSLRRQLHS